MIRDFYSWSDQLEAIKLLKLASTKKRYSDTAIQEQEPGTGTETAHKLCKLSHFITAEDISDNIFQGGDFSRESCEIYGNSSNKKEWYS